MVVSRLKRKETANVLLIGSPGNGKNFIIKKETIERVDFENTVQVKLNFILCVHSVVEFTV